MPKYIITFLILRHSIIIPRYTKVYALLKGKLFNFEKDFALYYRTQKNEY